MCNLDFREWGRSSRNDLYTKGESAVSISLESKKRMALCLTWEEERSTLGHFCPVSRYMNWKVDLRFNASFLKQWTKSLFVPQWNLPLKSYTTSCEIQLCRCAMGDPPTMLPSLKVQEWALCTDRLKWHLPIWSPWGSQVGKMFYLREQPWAVDV